MVFIIYSPTEYFVIVVLDRYKQAVHSQLSFFFAEINFTEIVELLHVPLQTLYTVQPNSKLTNNTIENGHYEYERE